MLGYDSVSQEDFPTGYGELRQWLQSQIDSCEGVIQIVGQAYGAEPPSVDPAHGRVSYTQFEFLYARDLGKKTWVIVVGTGYPVDKPTPRLDLPSDSADVDAAAYQAERHLLQLDYVELLRRDNHLRYEVNRPIELENTILRLRDDLSNLRRDSDRHLRRIWVAIGILLAGLAVLISGMWLANQRLRSVQNSSVVTTEKVRGQLRQSVEEVHHRELADAERVSDWRQRSACARPWRLHTQNG